MHSLFVNVSNSHLSSFRASIEDFCNERNWCFGSFLEHMFFRRPVTLETLELQLHLWFSCRKDSSNVFHLDAKDMESVYFLLRLLGSFVNSCTKRAHQNCSGKLMDTYCSAQKKSSFFEEEFNKIHLKCAKLKMGKIDRMNRLIFAKYLVKLRKNSFRMEFLAMPS